MSEIDPLERQVIRLRYGLHAHESLSIPLIAERLRLSRERVRTLEARAIQKLRRGKSLRSYLN
jgi:DNA-directed RNA polymerase sigma subunit (sigma70/sigma32)